LPRYFFLKLSKIDILEKLRFLARSFSASCVLTCPVESKPNSRMIKTKTISVVLMASSIIDKKSPRRECRPEHRAMDLRRRTRRKGSSPSFGRFDLSSSYFSQVFEDRHFRKREVSFAMLCRSTEHDWSAMSFLKTPTFYLDASGASR
jgi:hypothetical protein